MPLNSASRPASSKKYKSKQSKTPRNMPSPRLMPSPKEITKMLSKSFNASPLHTLPMKLLTFNASPLSPTKKRHSRAAKKMQALFRGYKARKMTKKVKSAAKKMQALFRGRSARNRTGRMRTARREQKQKSEKKKEGLLSRMMKNLDLRALPDISAPRTLRTDRQLTSRLKY